MYMYVFTTLLYIIRENIQTSISIIFFVNNSYSFLKVNIEDLWFQRFKTGCCEYISTELTLLVSYMGFDWAELFSLSWYIQIYIFCTIVYIKPTRT